MRVQDLESHDGVGVRSVVRVLGEGEFGVPDVERRHAHLSAGQATAFDQSCTRFIFFYRILSPRIQEFIVRALLQTHQLF